MVLGCCLWVGQATPCYTCSCLCACVVSAPEDLHVLHPIASSPALEHDRHRMTLANTEHLYPILSPWDNETIHPQADGHQYSKTLLQLYNPGPTGQEGSVVLKPLIPTSRHNRQLPGLVIAARPTQRQQLSITAHPLTSRSTSAY